MPRVSFVIPVLREQENISKLLSRLREQYPESELLVVDGGSDDDTVVRAMPLCDQLLIGPPGRALQMNLGGQVAKGEYLFFLHADSSPGVGAQQLQAYLDSAPQWGFCRVRLSGGRRVFRVIEWFMNQRSRITRIGTGDQMLFLQRTLFLESGGFDAIPLMEDVAYCKRLRQTAPPLVIREAITTSSRRWEQHGVMATVLRMWLLRLGYFVGVSPDRLRQFYAS